MLLRKTLIKTTKKYYLTAVVMIKKSRDEFDEDVEKRKSLYLSPGSQIGFVV